MSVQRIPLGSPEDLESTVRYELKRNVGPGLFVTGCKKVKTGRYSFDIGNSFLEIIEDSRKDVKPLLLSRRVESTFSVDVIEDKGRYAIVLPESEVIIESLSKKMNVVATKSETALVGTAHDRFVKIPVVATALYPIFQILETVDKNGSVSPLEIYHRKGVEKITKYLDFLSHLDFLKRENGGYVPGEAFKAFQNSSGGRTPYDKILANVLEQGYEYLQSYFHLTMLTPYIRISNSYYYPSQQYGDRLRMMPELLRDYEKRLYKRGRPLNQLKSHAGRMTDVNIFNEEDSFIVGEPSLYDSYCRAVGSSDLP